MKKLLLAWVALIIGSLAVITAAISDPLTAPFARPARRLSAGGNTLVSKAVQEKYVPATVERMTPEVPSPRLSPCDEQVAEHPFATKAARLVMRHRLDTEGETDGDDLGDRGDMGWIVPDRKYWKTIPPAARRIPAKLSALPMVRFTNTEIDGERRIWLKQGPEWDQWILRDAEHEVWACISVQHDSKRIYFMEMASLRKGGWRLRQGHDNCYSCHPSGPRTIRPFATKTVNSAILSGFNRRILSYGACNFGGSVDLRLRGKPMRDVRCIGCHDGTQRGRLYAIHSHTVQFKTKWEKSMPPAPVLF